VYIYKNIIPERFENARENHENMVKYCMYLERKAMYRRE
jgi:hypothetical protein